MKNLRVHCLAKVLNNDDHKILQDITGFDFIDFDGTYDSIPDETIQDVYEKMSESELEALFEKYGILGVMPYDGKHAIADGIVPKPNVQLRIEFDTPLIKIRGFLVRRLLPSKTKVLYSLPKRFTYLVGSGMSYPTIYCI